MKNTVLSTPAAAPVDIGAWRTLPLQVGGSARGLIVPAVAERLHAMPAIFVEAGASFVLRDAGLDRLARSRLLQHAAIELRKAGLVPGWRDELCELLDAEGQELARFERGAFRTLGLQNRAVHINGRLPDGRLWIARRSARKHSSPGKLDNFATGAIAADETPMDCALRELWEEAGTPADIACLTRFTGHSLRSLRPLAHGIHDEILLCADLALPSDFTPVCQDGEVDGFLCMTRAEVEAALTHREFSVEASLVVQDWLERHP